MLHQFLEKHKDKILILAEEKSLRLAGDLQSSEELKRGLPAFYNLLISYLKDPIMGSLEKKILESAASHGKELLRLDYSLSHVVHAYGAMCQAITEMAQQEKTDISSKEFNDLNLCLDAAIAAAVTEFQFHSAHATEEREVQHLGILVHELRNALSSATIAHQMIKKGLVGTSGSTARVLESSLARMRTLIDRSLSDIRMRADPEIVIEKFQLNELIDQILLTSQNGALVKMQRVVCEAPKKINLETDRQLLLSAIANLIQNALKYTKIHGQVTVRAKIVGENAVMEIEDECGGITPDTFKNLFRPFASGGLDQTGLGLGMTIIQRAVTLLQGKISIQNNLGKGCIFLIEFPIKLVPVRSTRASVQGKDSVQPENLKKK